MPEGPELRIEADRLKKYINKEIISIKWNEKSKFFKKEINGLKLISYPLKIKNIWTRGKVLVFETENAYLVSQLGMTGFWTHINSKHCDLWFEFNNSKLYFNDYRHFGNLTICKDLECIWKNHGPCLLSTALKKWDNISPNTHQKIVNLKYYLEKLNNSRIQNKKICIYLLEQKHVSGVGNYLRNEVLYLTKISPHRKLKELTLKEKEDLFNASLRVIYSAYKSKGPPNGYYPDGKFKLMVYNQEQDFLGNKVVKEKIQNRTIHWVPEIQK